MCIFKNTDQNNICASIIFKAKTKVKYEETFFLQFLFQSSKMPFFGVKQFFFRFSFKKAFKAESKSNHGEKTLAARAHTENLDFDF